MAARRRHKSELRESREDAIRRVTKKHDRPGTSRDLRWFQEDNPHELIFSLYEKISRLTSGRRADDLYNACLYEDAEFASLFQGMQAQGEFTPQTMVSNVVKRQVDTYQQRQDKNRPVPMAQPIDARASQQARAELLSQFFGGVLDQVEYFPTLSMRRRDRAIWGDGFAQNYRIGTKLIHERCFPIELLVDPFEARYGKPRTLIRQRWIDRLVLAERFPKHEAAILNDEYGSTSADAAFDYSFGRDETSDMVFLLEIWHLPNGEPTEKDSKDGAHCICISSATLSNRVYKRDYFPFSHTSFSKGLAGWRGQGMATQLRGLQYEVNSIGLRLQEQGWMTGTYVWTPTDTGVEVDHLDNGTLTHIQSEVQPVFFQPSPWHPAFFDYYQFLRGRAAAEETRLSEMSTRGELPPGLESGKAVRAWNQLDDQAFLSHGQEDERDAIDTCWQFFDLCEEINEEQQAEKKSGKKPEPLTVEADRKNYGKTLIEKLSYADVRMDRKDFKLRVFPTSLLAGTPAEQYQSAKEIAADGLISRDAVLELLQIPDVQRVLRYETANRRLVLKTLEKILRSTDPASAYMYPEPAFNLELCRALALQVYADAITDEQPEANLRWILQFALDAEEQLEAAENEAAAAAGPPAAGGGAPVDPAAAGADPALFAEPQGRILPEGAVPQEAVPMLPAM